MKCSISQGDLLSVVANVPHVATRPGSRLLRPQPFRRFYCLNARRHGSLVAAAPRSIGRGAQCVRPMPILCPVNLVGRISHLLPTRSILWAPEWGRGSFVKPPAREIDLHLHTTKGCPQWISRSTSSSNSLTTEADALSASMRTASRVDSMLAISPSSPLLSMSSSAIVARHLCLDLPPSNLVCIHLL